MKRQALQVGVALVIGAIIVLALAPTRSEGAFFSSDQYDYIFSTSSSFHQHGVFDYWYWSWISYAEAWGTSFGDYWGVWWTGLDWYTWFQSQVAVDGVFHDALFRYEMD